MQSAMQDRFLKFASPAQFIWTPSWETFLSCWCRGTGKHLGKCPCMDLTSGSQAPGETKPVGKPTAEVSVLSRGLNDCPFVEARVPAQLRRNQISW